MLNFLLALGGLNNSRINESLDNVRVSSASACADVKAAEGYLETLDKLADGEGNYLAVLTWRPSG